MIPILLAVAIAAGSPGDLKTFRDWIVGCDNRLACHATTLDPVSTPEEVETGDEPIADNAIGLAILRGAAALDEPRIRFLPRYAYDPEPNPDPGSIRHLAVLDTAGKVIFRLEFSPQDIVRANAPEGLPVPADSALWQALAAGGTIMLHRDPNTSLARISLRGLRDTMRHMDESQHRIGNVTALVERGKEAAHLVPLQVPDQPVIVPPTSALSPTKLSRAALLRLQDKHKCGRREARPAAIYQRLDDRMTMLLLNAACSSYNGEGYVYVVDNDRNARIAAIRLNDSDPPLAAPQVVSAWWDETERRLHSFGRGRAIADCGQQQAFAWDGEQFFLIREAAMGECRGSVDYITIYRRRTIERGKRP